MSGLVTAHGLAIPGRLQSTSLTLVAGQFVCLIGPNGSGKTSLLHALAGISGAVGEVRIGGTDPKLARPNERQRLFTYLPATRDIKWPLKASDLIALGLPDGCETDDVVSRLELGALLDRRVDRLSTGERSRVLIARALAADPKLLLLDEATANLDPLWQLKVMDELRNLAAVKGKAVLLAIHDLDLALLYADRIIVMSRGAIHADGKADARMEESEIPAIFGIERTEKGWRPAARPPADPLSSR